MKVDTKLLLISGAVLPPLLIISTAMVQFARADAPTALALGVTLGLVLAAAIQAGIRVVVRVVGWRSRQRFVKACSAWGPAAPREVVWLFVDKGAGVPDVARRMGLLDVGLTGDEQIVNRWQACLFVEEVLRTELKKGGGG